MKFKHLSAVANQTPRRAFAWIGVFAIAMMQLSVAGHQFEHVSNDLSQTCQVCAQQDKSDDAPVFSFAAAIWSVGTPHAVYSSDHLVLNGPQVFHRSRAPPHS